ncbi:MAG: IclR family transcriptional regulator [Chitinophagales bacterium]
MGEPGLQNNKRKSTVQSVERSLSILEALATKREPMTLSDIGKICELKPSTVHRLLATLIRQGFAAQDSMTGKYRLGLKIFQIGNASLYSLDLRSIARPHLSRLGELCEETVNLVVFGRSIQGPEMVYIDQIESPKTIRTIAKIGSKVPIHCTGSGKVLLAYMSTRELENILKSLTLEEYTNRTITDSKELLAVVKKVQENGYALDLEETELGVVCVAVPIWNYENQVIGTISISGPANRMMTSLDRLIDLTKETGFNISVELGYNPRLDS